MTHSRCRLDAHDSTPSLPSLQAPAPLVAHLHVWPLIKLILWRLQVKVLLHHIVILGCRALAWHILPLARRWALGAGSRVHSGGGRPPGAGWRCLPLTLRLCSVVLSLAVTSLAAGSCYRLLRLCGRTDRNKQGATCHS